MDSNKKQYCEKPCKTCPFRRDVKPFLHPERASELASSTENPYQSFTCHQTLGYNEEGDTRIESDSLKCAGFLTMQYDALGRTDYDEDGFKASSELVYADAWEMSEAYEEEWK